MSATLYTKKRINGKLEAVPLPGREIVFLVRWYKKSYPGNKYDVRYTGNTDIQGVATFNIHVPRKAARGDRKLRIEFAGDALPVNEETYQGRYRISKIRVVAP
ncbi:MAG: hypothetical protein SFU56_09550 [Capsulimonadales bacterium]|nr:hypothetical protein [Capsulimonadales bacterium]